MFMHFSRKVILFMRSERSSCSFTSSRHSQYIFIRSHATSMLTFLSSSQPQQRMQYRKLKVPDFSGRSELQQNSRSPISISKEAWVQNCMMSRKVMEKPKRPPMADNRSCSLGKLRSLRMQQGDLRRQMLMYSSGKFMLSFTSARSLTSRMVSLSMLLQGSRLLSVEMTFSVMQRLLTMVESRVNPKQSRSQRQQPTGSRVPLFTYVFMKQQFMLQVLVLLTVDWLTQGREGSVSFLHFPIFSRSSLNVSEVNLPCSSTVTLGVGQRNPFIRSWSQLFAPAALTCAHCSYLQGCRSCQYSAMSEPQEKTWVERVMSKQRRVSLRLRPEMPTPKMNLEESSKLKEVQVGSSRQQSRSSAMTELLVKTMAESWTRRAPKTRIMRRLRQPPVKVLQVVQFLYRSIWAEPKRSIFHRKLFSDCEPL